MAEYDADDEAVFLKALIFSQTMHRFFQRKRINQLLDLFGDDDPIIETARNECAELMDLRIRRVVKARTKTDAALEGTDD